MTKKKIPFIPCDDCVWWTNHYMLPWKEFIKAYKIKYPKAYENLIKEEKEFFASPRRNDDFSPSPADNLKETKTFWPKLELSKCPFDFKPNLKIIIRRKYTLKCFRCGEYLGCPANVSRENAGVICGVCLADSYYDDSHDYIEY